MTILKRYSLLLLAGLLAIAPLFAQSSSVLPKSTPEAEGISSAAILSFVNRVEEEVDDVHSYMLLRHGKVVSQGWWAPYSPDAPHVMHSMSKSFTSTAIGFAVQEGTISLDDRVAGFFPDEMPNEPEQTDNFRAMRVRDLLAMNTGHKDEPSFWLGGENWVEYFLAQEVDFKPGTHFKYNSPATYMLSAIITKETGESLVDYLDSRLWKPLDIPKPEWDTCPKGINTGGWGLHIRTEDIAKLGQLYLQKGMWNGKRLLSEEWVEMATSRQTSNGSDPQSDWEQGYGYQFWMSRYDAYRGDGAFGQFCIVMPEQDAVLAITSGTNEMWKILEIAWEEVLLACKPEAVSLNEMEAEKLAIKNNSLSIEPIKGETSSTISKKLRKKTFAFNEGPNGLQSAQFALHGDTHTITLEMNGGSQTLEIGSDTYVRGQLEQLIPYADRMESGIGCSGAWTADDTYELRLEFYESPARLNYTFVFEGETVSWFSKLEYHLFGVRETPSFEGTAATR